MRYENTNPEMAVFTTKPMGNKNTSPVVEVPKTCDCPPDKLPTLAYSTVSKKMCENSVVGLYDMKDGKVNDRRRYVDLKEDSNIVSSYYNTV